MTRLVACARGWIRGCCVAGVAALVLAGGCASSPKPAPAIPDEVSEEPSDGDERLAELDQAAQDWVEVLTERVLSAHEVRLGAVDYVAAHLYEPTLEVIALDNDGWERRAAIILLDVAGKVRESDSPHTLNLFEFKREFVYYLFKEVGCPRSLDIEVAARLSKGTYGVPTLLAMLTFPGWSDTFDAADAGVRKWLSDPEAYAVAAWLWLAGQVHFYIDDLSDYIRRVAQAQKRSTDRDLSVILQHLNEVEDRAVERREKMSELVVGTYYEGWFRRQE